jgi:SAM-dependent methyltransferase
MPFSEISPQSHAIEDYQDLIADPNRDSKFIRDSGLLPNVLDLIGECRDASLLDAGTGSGWLFNHISPKTACACDIIRPANLPPEVEFRQEDVAGLSYESGQFDTIVASLLLIYCKDLLKVCREFRRISRPHNGKLVVALMHPYFYRTGHVASDGSFTITRDLSRSSSFALTIAEEVGPFEYFYRPLPDYLNALIKTGWIISEVRDWFINMNDHASAGAATKVGRTGSIPLFTFIACRGL